MLLGEQFCLNFPKCPGRYFLTQNAQQIQEKSVDEEIPVLLSAVIWWLCQKARGS